MCSDGFIKLKVNMTYKYTKQNKIDKRTKVYRDANNLSYGGRGSKIKRSNAVLYFITFYMAFMYSYLGVTSHILGSVQPRIDPISWGKDHHIIEEEQELNIDDLFYNTKYKWDASLMKAICFVENGYRLRGYWDPQMEFIGNTDGSIDRGICSINSIHGYTEAELFDPITNIDIAYEIWKSQGYEAWVVYLDGRY